jgi:RNA polymerase sigma factor (sigma-70 family)
MSALEALDSNATETALSPESALTGLFERHGDRIFGFCLRKMGSRQEAEDAHQNTFLYAFRALQRGVRPISETAWLFKIAENACLAAHRSNGRRRAREIDHDPELIGAFPAGEEESGTAAALRTALDKLPTNQRQALLLREWRGLSYREIAAELGLTVAAVETLIFRARRSVARTLTSDTGIRARLAGVLDLGSLVSALKGAFSGAAAVKVAAAAAVVTLVTLPAGDTRIQTSSSVASDKTVAGAEESSATAGGGVEASRPNDHASGRDARPAAPANGAKKDEAHTAPPGGPGAPGTPSAPTDAGGPPAATSPAVPAVPREVEVPAPKVEVPAIPEPPPLPQLPQLPQLPALPQAPAPPALPGLPEVPALPAVPALPKVPTDLLQPPPQPK